MKLIKNPVCRQRFKVQTKVRKWVNGGRWTWGISRKKKPVKVEANK